MYPDILPSFVKENIPVVFNQVLIFRFRNKSGIFGNCRHSYRVLFKLNTVDDQFSTIVLLIKQSRNNAIQAVNIELINLYWNVGRYITKQLAIANWGEKTVDELAAFIHKNYPELRGFNRRGLYRMKQFYDTYASQSFVSSSMALIQVKSNQENKIVSSAMTQL